MTKYRIEVTERQLRLIADCVEDCCRFASGQTELGHTASHIGGTQRELQDGLRKLHGLVVPELGSPTASYGWDGGGCPRESQRLFIARTYPIYREILHFLAMEQGADDLNVYRSDTLTCEEGGEPVMVDRVDDEFDREICRRMDEFLDGFLDTPKPDKQ